MAAPTPTGQGIDAARHLRKLIALPPGLQAHYPTFKKIQPKPQMNSLFAPKEDPAWSQREPLGDQYLAEGDAEDETFDESQCVHSFAQSFIDDVISSGIQKYLSQFEDSQSESFERGGGGDESFAAEEGAAGEIPRDIPWIESELQSMKELVNGYEKDFSVSLKSYLRMKEKSTSQQASEAVSSDGPRHKGIQCCLRTRGTRLRHMKTITPSRRVRTSCAQTVKHPCRCKGEHIGAIHTREVPNRKQSASQSLPHGQDNSIELSLRRNSSRSSVRKRKDSVKHPGKSRRRVLRSLDELRTNKQQTVNSEKARLKLALVFTADGRLRAWTNEEQSIRPRLPEVLKARLTPCR